MSMSVVLPFLVSFDSVCDGQIHFEQKYDICVDAGVVCKVQVRVKGCCDAGRGGANAAKGQTWSSASEALWALAK